MKRIIIAGLATGLAFAGVFGAQAARPDKEEVMAGFERTGELENCVSLQRIDSTQILDDQTILFRMTDKDVYLNELPHRCPQLRSQDAFSYRTSINRLCNTDIITVLDTALNQQLASCGLGQFEKLEPKEQAGEQTSEQTD